MKVFVIGLGFVGISLVSRCLEVGHEVFGFDISNEAIENVEKKISEEFKIHNSRQIDLPKFTATSDPSEMRRCNVILICVPTPLNYNRSINLDAIKLASEEVSRYMPDRALVVLKSTSFPGTTDEIVKPILESRGKKVNSDFYLAFSSERVDPGQSKFNVENTCNVIGADGSQSEMAAIRFFETICNSNVIAKGTREAELSKLIENTYRYVNIGFINELARYSSSMGWDIWNAIDCASTKPFGFQTFYPGPGVGGHCIPIDPNYLYYKIFNQIGQEFRFVTLANEINTEMPRYICDRSMTILKQSDEVQGQQRILIIGVTYKKDFSDTRETPAFPIIKNFLKLGLQVDFIDPYVNHIEIELEPSVGGNSETVKLASKTIEDETLDRSDLILVLQHHRILPWENIASRAKIIFDVSGKLTGSNIVHL